MTQPPVPPTPRPDADVDAPVATAAEVALVEAATSSAPVDDLPPVSKRYIWLQVLGQFGVFMAFITPIAISLALRIDALAPGHAEYLGYVTGAGALVPLLTGPFLGVLSDRMRTRWGRRRPMMVAGLVIGVIALFVMATAPNVLLLGVGWLLAQLGWGQVLGNLQISTADCLPEQQRGKVAGLTSFATQVAPVFGVILAQFFTTNSLLLFFVPGLVGVVFTLLFVFLIHEPDSRGMVLEPLTVPKLLSKYVYRPTDYPDFSWNWLGRFFFYLGITLNTTFTAFFFADRLGIEVAAVAGIIAMLGLGGVLATTIGAIGGGFLSDKFKRRRAFVMFGATLMAAGMVTMALSASLPALVTGSLLGSMGLGMFAAVDQALLLDVLPEKATDAGRFMGITGFATSIPQSVGPLIASGILLVGVTGAERNYSLLYLIAAGIILLGGLAILRIRSVR